MKRGIIIWLLFFIFTAACSDLRPEETFISKDQAKEVALVYIADESAQWNLQEIEVDELDQYWIVRFKPVRNMPELLWLHVDKRTGEILKVITDS